MDFFPISHFHTIFALSLVLTDRFILANYIHFYTLYCSGIMYSLEDQIELYIDDNFNAEAAAQHFFASYGESDISKKLNEMGNIQLSIETVLKQKVRTNYGMFLQANEQINQVGVEMADLKHLIENTQKLINVS